MNKSQSQTSSKKVYSQIFSLEPSVLIQLYEIDLTDIAFDVGLIQSVLETKDTIYRFHNNLQLTNNSLFWRGYEYVASPIQAEGFEINSQGTSPTPKLTISVADESIKQLAMLKEKIYQLGDLTGVKVTRIRTFAKYLDRINFVNNTQDEEIFGSSGYSGASGYEGVVQTYDAGNLMEFDPDPYAELPRDIYFIDRKSSEGKNFIQYELTSSFDVDGIKIPGRLVVKNRCTFFYRGEGCMYEYSNRRVDEIHGESSKSTLPFVAPAVANDRDESLQDILGIDTQIVDKGKYESDGVYLKGHTVYIEKAGIKYYFVANVNSPAKPPPDTKYWLSDTCSKTIKGCKLRWARIGQGFLPYGGFIGVDRGVS